MNRLPELWSMIVDESLTLAVRVRAVQNLLDGWGDCDDRDLRPIYEAMVDVLGRATRRIEDL